jgi:hypothetical protein
MKYVVEMGLGAMIYIPSFIKIGFRQSNFFFSLFIHESQHSKLLYDRQFTANQFVLALSPTTNFFSTELLW